MSKKSGMSNNTKVMATELCDNLTHQSLLLIE